MKKAKTLFGALKRCSMASPIQPFIFALHAIKLLYLLRLNNLLKPIEKNIFIDRSFVFKGGFYEGRG